MTQDLSYEQQIASNAAVKWVKENKQLLIILFDHALHTKTSLILDGTFAYKNVAENITRSLHEGRKVSILFVYQDPLKAWDITKKREALERRHVSKETFINAFFKSKTNISNVRDIFGSKIGITLLIKDFDKDSEEYIENVDKIDPYLPHQYTEEELVKIIL